MKKIFILLFICFCSFHYTQAQATREYFRLSIEVAKQNGVDVTKTYKDNDAYLSFSKNADNEQYFANVWKSSKSYGMIMPLSKKEKDNVYTFLYEWYYQNTYNDDSGTALIELKITNGETYQLVMTTEDSLMIFTGCLMTD